MAITIVLGRILLAGTNTYSGNIFSFFRHDALNAKEHFEKYAPDGTPLDQAKAPYSQYQFGGTLGGPIRRNRSFFFLSAERLRVGANNFVNIDDVNPIIVFGRDYGTVVDVLRADNFPVEVGHVPYRVESDQVLVKADTMLNPAHHLALRFNWGALLDENAEPWGGQVAESAGAYLDSHDLMGALSLTSAFSARTLNELRLLVANRDRAVISLDPTCDGVCDRDDEGGPALSIGDIQVGSWPQPQVSVPDRWSFCPWPAPVTRRAPGAGPLSCGRATPPAFAAARFRVVLTVPAPVRGVHE